MKNCKCKHPEKLEDENKKCKEEQIKECHGDVENHECECDGNCDCEENQKCECHEESK